MSNLQNLLATLSPEKRARLLKKVRKQRQSGSASKSLSARENDPAAIVPIPRTEPISLSFAQQRLWFLDQLQGGSTAYNMPAALHLAGSLDVAALERTLSEMMRRHESLRTTFPMQNGSPVQRIAPLPPSSSRPVLGGSEGGLSVVNLERLSDPDEQEAEVRRLIAQEAEQPFDLAEGPLLRVTLLRLAPRSNVLVLTMHHIISDGWSIGIFIRELSTLYDVFLHRKPNPLPPLTIQYADFAHWQRQWLSGEVLEGQLTYWKKQLAGAPPLLDLPTDYLRPPVQSFQGARYTHLLPQALSQKLTALSNESKVTLFMTLSAAFAVLLSRYAEQDDILIGTPVANRHRVEIEPLIGLFVNTLMLRTDLSANPTFRELLSQVQEVALETYKHQDLPFELLVDALQPERNLSHSALFQVMFVLQNLPQEKHALSGLSVTRRVMKHVTAKFDLMLAMKETAQGLSGAWEYNTDLFEAGTIQRMATDFHTLLEGIVANPELRIKALPIRALDFRQRRENPVNIRGYRVRVGEVEGVLNAHPQVRQSLVIARQKAGTQRLVAYVIFDDKMVSKEKASVDELGLYLSKKLPSYMVPSAFVRLDALPRLPSGEVDKQALPAPIPVRRRTSPTTATEKGLVAIWQTLLAKPVTIHQTFFELGGHSLLATQVISRVRDAFAVELPLRSFFANPTIAGLAERIDALKTAQELQVSTHLTVGEWEVGRL